MPRKCKLIFALDLPKRKDFLRWVDSTKELVEFYKVGLLPFTALGKEAITILKKRRKKVFLDLKFFDIPNKSYPHEALAYLFKIASFPRHRRGKDEYKFKLSTSACVFI